MKSNIKFLMALGTAKLVMLQDKTGSSFYGHSDNTIAALKKTNLERIAAALTETQ